MSKLLLSEMPWPTTMGSSQRPSTFTVDYYATTPNGTSSRFTRTSTLDAVRQAASETAILGLLRKIHPRCDIQIQNLKFK